MEHQYGHAGVIPPLPHMEFVDTIQFDDSIYPPEFDHTNTSAFGCGNPNLDESLDLEVPLTPVGQVINSMNWKSNHGRSSMSCATTGASGQMFHELLDEKPVATSPNAGQVIKSLFPQEDEVIEQHCGGEEICDQVYPVNNRLDDDIVQLFMRESTNQPSFPSHNQYTKQQPQEFIPTSPEFTTSTRREFVSPEFSRQEFRSPIRDEIDEFAIIKEGYTSPEFNRREVDFASPIVSSTGGPQVLRKSLARKKFGSFSIKRTMDPEETENFDLLNVERSPLKKSRKGLKKCSSEPMMVRKMQRSTLNPDQQITNPFASMLRMEGEELSLNVLPELDFTSIEPTPLATPRMKKCASFNLQRKAYTERKPKRQSQFAAFDDGAPPISPVLVQTKRSSTRFWTKAEDQLLREAVERYNASNWKAISQHVPGRTHIQCLQRWKKVLQPGLVKGKWSKEEDELLIQLIKDKGIEEILNDSNSGSVKGWAEIAREVPGRTAKQCRERWNSSLNPNINRNPWTEREDDLIIELVKVHGHSWAHISRQCDNRTENAVKCRYSSLIRSQKRDAEIQWSPELEESLAQLSQQFNGNVEQIQKHLPKPLKGLSAKAIRKKCHL